MNSNWHNKNNKKKKQKNEKKTNHGVNFCTVEYYSHTCGLYTFIYSKNVTIIWMIIVIYW